MGRVIPFYDAYLLSFAECCFSAKWSGLSPLVAGLYFIAPGILFTMSSVAAGKLISRFGTMVLQAGILIILITFGLQIAFFKTGAGIGILFLLQATYGLGNGLVLPSLLNITLRSLPASFACTAAGVYSTVQQTASALGVCLVGGLYFYLADRTHSIQLAYHYALVALILCGVLVTVMLLCLPKKVKGAAVSEITE